MAVHCPIMKAQVRRELDRLELLIEQIKGVEADGMSCSQRRNPQRPRRRRRYLTSRASGPSSPLSFGRRHSSGILPTESRLRPTRAWRRRPGKVGR